MSPGGAAHDVYETRGRLRGAASAEEFDRWRELPPRLYPVDPAPLSPDVARLLHRLRLRYVREAGPAVLARAREEGWDHEDLLKVLLAEEAAGRDRSTRELHRKAARLPSGKTFDAWDPKASAIPGDAQWALRTLDWIGRAENLVLVGPSGTGKTVCGDRVTLTDTRGWSNTKKAPEDPLRHEPPRRWRPAWGAYRGSITTSSATCGLAGHGRCRRPVPAAARQTPASGGGATGEPFAPRPAPFAFRSAACAAASATTRPVCDRRSSPLGGSTPAR